MKALIKEVLALRDELIRLTDDDETNLRAHLEDHYFRTRGLNGSVCRDRRGRPHGVAAAAIGRGRSGAPRSEEAGSRRDDIYDEKQDEALLRRRCGRGGAWCGAGVVGGGCSGGGPDSGSVGVPGASPPDLGACRVVSYWGAPPACLADPRGVGTAPWLPLATVAKAGSVLASSGASPPGPWRTAVGSWPASAMESFPTATMVVAARTSGRWHATPARG